MKKHERTSIKSCQPRPATEKCGIRYFKNSPRGHFVMHRHSFIEIEYIADGEMEHELNGVKKALAAGGCYCLDQRDQHRFTVTKPITIHNLCIVYKNAPSVIQRLISSAKMPLIGSVSDAHRGLMNEWFKQLDELISSSERYAEERIIALVLLIISRIFESSEEISERGYKSNEYGHVAKAIDYMYEHYSERLLLSDVANAVYLSPNYFSKLFCEVSGMPFSDYLTKLRIDRACDALCDSETSITAVALECGFSSFSTFSRSFKRLCGCTPSEYRTAYLATE